MSSRVQKGGQKFRPVANVRPRAEGTPAPRKPPSTSKPSSNAKPPSKRTALASSTETKKNHLSTSESLLDGPGDEYYGDRATSPVLSRRNDVPPQISRLGSSSQAVHPGPSVASEPSMLMNEEALPLPRAEPTDVALNIHVELDQLAPSQTQREPQAHASSSQLDATDERPPLVEEIERLAEPLPSSEGPADDDDELGGRMQRTKRTSTRLQSRTIATQVDSTENGHAMDARRTRKRTAKKEPQAKTQENDNASEDSSAESAVSKPKRRRRATKRKQTSEPSEGTSTRRRRKTKEPLLSEDVDPGEELDPTIVTMADICADTGQGRISSKAISIQRNHLAWKAANRAKRDRMRAIMEAKKYGRKDDDADAAAGPAPSNSKESDAEDDASQVESALETPGPDETIDENGFDYKQRHSTNRFNAQIRIGPNGETIIDEESLFVERAEEDDTSNQYQHVEESEQKKFTNSASYGKKPGSSRWSAEETDLFYDALQQFGENYELISYILPGRDRKSCKSKFKLEDRKNPNRITYCLKHRLPYDIETLSRLTGKDFSGPTPELRTPDIPAPEASTSQTPTTDANTVDVGSTSNSRKKARTPAAADDVEVVGDVDMFDPGFISDD